jgi:hypothetical protein
MSFATLPNTGYRVVVASKFDADPAQVGNLKLSWYPTPPPGFTGSQFSPGTGLPGTKITLTGTNFTGATAILFTGVSASFTNAPTNNLDLRIAAIVPTDATSGPITIVTPHGNVTSTVTFQVNRPLLTITRASADQLTVSWTGTAFILESSVDLRAWELAAAAGQSSASLPLTGTHKFFRLRSP